MPITASSGGLTYLKGGSGFGAYDWWVAYNGNVTYNTNQLIGDKFYMTGTDETIAITADSAFFTAVSPEDIENPTWANRLLYGAGKVSSGISGSFAINPNTNILFQTGVWSVNVPQDIWGQVAYYNTNGSLIQNFTLYPTVVANVPDLRSPGNAIYKNNNFYSVGVNTTASVNVSGTFYSVNAITFTKYNTSTTTLNPPQTYRFITFGATTATFNPFKTKLSPNGDFIVAGSFTTSSAPTTTVPFVFSSGELTNNWSRQFDWVNRFNGRVADMCIDSNDNIYLAMVSSFGNPTQGVIVKLDSTGTLLWAVSADSGTLTGIACDDTGCYVTSSRVITGPTSPTSTWLIWKFDTSGNKVYVNKLDIPPPSPLPPGSIPAHVNMSYPLISGGALYLIGNIDKGSLTTANYGAIWKLPKDGSIPGDGNYTVGVYNVTYSSVTNTAGSFSVTMTSLPLFESTPSYGTTSQETTPINTTIYPNTFVPLT